MLLKSSKVEQRFISEKAKVRRDAYTDRQRKIRDGAERS